MKRHIQQTQSRIEMYYPFLPGNEKQKPDGPVLSADGKEIAPRLPEGATLDTYTEKEVWLYEVAFDIEGHRALMDTVEAAQALLTQAKHILKRERARDRRGTVSDVIEDFPPLPLADHKRVRDIHIILHIVCRAREEGLETGIADFRCQHCNKRFLLLTANDNTSQNEDSDGEVASIVPFPAVRLGFTEVQQLIDNHIVKCPHCRKDTYPVSTIPLDFD